MQRHRENETSPALDTTLCEVFHLTNNQTCMTKAADKIPACLRQNLVFWQGNNQRKERKDTQNTESIRFFNIIYNLNSKINVNYNVNIISRKKNGF